MSVSVPLTPALSLGERGNCFRSLGKTTNGFCSMTIQFPTNGQRLFPLPEGEGQGEGERNGVIHPAPPFALATRYRCVDSNASASRPKIQTTEASSSRRSVSSPHLPHPPVASADK